MVYTITENALKKQGGSRSRRPRSAMVLLEDDVKVHGDDAVATNHGGDGAEGRAVVCAIAAVGRRDFGSDGATVHAHGKSGWNQCVLA